MSLSEFIKKICEILASNCEYGLIEGIQINQSRMIITLADGSRFEAEFKSVI